MSIPKDILKEHNYLNDWSIITAYRGSIAHGMYVPNTDPNSIDDKDVMSVCVPPKEYYLGLQNFGSRGTKELFKGEWDIVTYELKKFASLLKRGNPNVISLLWLEPNHYLNLTTEGQWLIDNRHLFINKTTVYKSFVGYAHGQLKRMTHHSFEGYMGEKRKNLVKKFGYDTKNAAHLIRLLRMGCEYLSSGELIVQRPDAANLLSIKRGEWTLEQVNKEADRLFKRIDTCYDLCTFPNEPDHVGIDKLLVDIIENRHDYYKYNS